MAELTAGVKMTVFVPLDEEGGKLRLTSTLEGFGENKRLIIRTPVKGDSTKYPLKVGQTVALQCVMANAIIDFEAVTRQNIEKGVLSYVLMEQTTEFKRTQRRQDFRLECMKDGIIEYTDPVDSGRKRVEVIISDISGGGTSVRSPASFDIGTQVTAHLPIGDKDTTLSYISHVRRCFEIKESVSLMKYNVGLQFDFKDIRQKEDMISRVFKMERERRKTGS